MVALNYWASRLCEISHSFRKGAVLDSKNLSPSQFVVRRNDNGTVDAICLVCFLTAATAGTEAELHERENAHQCQGLAIVASRTLCVGRVEPDSRIASRTALFGY
jgi:hypothetical protein